MRFRTFTTVLVGIALFALIQPLPVPAHAEALDAPLLLVFDGDIWSWTGADSSLENLTHSGGVIVAGFSPDGTQVAYAEVPEPVREAQETDPWAGLIPHDVRLLDLASGASTLLAGQPDDMRVPEIYPAIIRTFPVWSPDGTMLAWTEGYDDAESEYKHTLVIYSLVEQQVILTQEIAQIELPTQLQWGAAGIALQNLVDDAIVFQVVDVEGRVAASVPAPGYGISTYQWVHTAAGEYLFLPVTDTHDGPQFFAPVSGQFTAVPDTLELYSLSAPEGASLISSRDYFGSISLMNFRIAFPGRSPVALPEEQYGFTVEQQYPYLAYSAAISPDGKSVAYANYTTVIIARNGEWIETGIELPLDAPPPQLLWSPVAWRVPEAN